MKEPTLRKSLIRIAVAVAVLLAAAAVIWLRGQKADPIPEDYTAQVIPPGCESGGYTLYTDPKTGAVIMEDILPATGHSYGPWRVETEPTLLAAGTRSRVCESCAGVEQSRFYADTGIPVIALEGELTGIGKKTEVDITARLFLEPTVESQATLKHQGHSSLQYDKKNYTLKLWVDGQRTEKNKLTLSHWNKENKYILKADYLDPTMCRNLICADVWASVTAGREDLPEEFTALSNYGAVDGFPTALYINGAFQGIYNLNLHKDDDLFGMSDGKPQAIMIANDPTAPEAFFREKAAFTGDSPWEVEFCGTEDKTWAEDKLNALITFVTESDDETFRRELDRYLDVQSAIDYLLSVYVLGLTHHGADELVLVCYGTDDPWHCSMYDMETGFGLAADGKTFLPADAFLPTRENGLWDSATQNLLWDRLLQNFYPQLCARYSELRRSVFDPDKLTERVAAFTDPIPASVYEANDAIHDGLPPAQTGIAQIRDYIQNRIVLTDKLFLENEG